MIQKNGIQSVWHGILRFFNTKNMAILLAVLFILCLIPLYALSAYSHPSADDYSYGLQVHEAWEQTGSLSDAFRAAVQSTSYIYHYWQGTFSAAFLMALQPGFLGESYYCIGAIFLITVLCAATALFLHVVLRRTLHMDGWSALLIGSVCLLLFTQFMPSAFSAFYWFNGGVFYIFFFSLSLVYASLILLRCVHNRRGAGCAVLILLISVVIGSGNYTTFLLCAVLLLALLIAEAVQKRFDPLLIAAFALLMGTFFASYFAPGTAIRAGVLGSTSFVKTVAVTFLYTGKVFSEQISLPVVLAVLFCTPVVARAAARADLRFRFPLLVTIGSFALVYIALFPPLFAIGGDVPDRLVNIVFFMEVLLLFVNLFYYLGWLKRVLGGADAGQDGESAFARIKRALCPRIGYFYLTMGVLTLLSMCNMSVLDRSSVQAAVELTSGEAAQFDLEMDARTALIVSTDSPDVIVPELSVQPALLSGTDIGYVPDYWVNQAVARYFGKNSVYMEWTGE